MTVKRLTQERARLEAHTRAIAVLESSPVKDELKGMGFTEDQEKTIEEEYNKIVTSLEEVAKALEGIEG